MDAETQHSPVEEGWRSRREVTLSTWRQPPYSRWGFPNVAKLVPCATISFQQEAVDRASAALPQVDLACPDGKRVALEKHLECSNGDSLVVMRDGAVLAEWQAPRTEPGHPHIVFSISKSITEMLAGIARSDGLLNVEVPVSHDVKVPEASVYARARVRDLLDMTVDRGFDEACLDKGGTFGRYRRAMLWSGQTPRPRR